MASILKVDTLKDTSDNNLVVKSGTTITVGTSGDTITIPSGATITNNGTATGFGASISNDGDNRVITADGSGGLNGEANLFFNGTNLGVGTSSPTFNNGTGLHLNSSTTDCRFHITNSATGTGSGDGAYVVSGGTGDMLLINMENANMLFYTNALERMRIDSSGLVGINTSSPTRQFNVYSTGIPVAKFERNQGDNNNRTHIEFIREGSSVGEIQCTNTSTTYATSSDYRLKENVIDLTDATTRVKQLQPKRFNFIADADTTVDGFLAHEVSDIVPEAITGTHNEVQVWEEGEELPEGVSVGDNKLDDEGNTIPVYQGIDQSKLVPLLTASLKEAITKIEELETRIATLENA